jgi:steroid 5-alpha reductase family enzyme
VIIAVPVAEVGRFYRMGRHDEYYDAQIVWWHF